ncbi:hypothetical protein BD289DRAFT_434082 [Coniella lustricola]|uniref:Protein SQS1 n=1 Tax=Coniella lustricola TaxID=2025994 RepID=A0A2T3A831_9PEZI|nr:hypothetical protein BD289DRAFT_434082 [Coniella lustricola]
MGKRRKGRAAKAARYRAAVEDSGPSSRGPRQTQQNAQKWIAKTQSQLRPAVMHGFSLADEARNTAHNHADMDPARKLRGLPVTFVSAGMIEPLKNLEELDLAQAADDCRTDGIVEESLPEGVEAEEEEEEGEEGEGEAPNFFVDVTGDQSLARFDYPQARIRSPSPDLPGDSSDSGEDVVLFKGRNGISAPRTPPVVVDQMVIEVHKVEQTIQSMSLISTDEARPPKSPSASPRPWQLRGYNDDEDLIADYMAHMVDDDDENEAVEADAHDSHHTTSLSSNTFSISRDLGGLHGDFVIESEESHSNNSVTSKDEDGDTDDGDNEEDGDEPTGSLDVRDGDLDAISDTDYMDDEALARLLAKQEELGLDDEELVLFSSERFEVLPSSNFASKRKMQPRGKPAVGASKKDARGLVPSASAIADVFDELDLMDWDRHNPPRKPKGKRGLPNLEHVDPEIAATLEATWNKDRLRKKERKLAREELRAQGILGKEIDPTDLRQKYPVGMTMDQIKEELRTFLLGEDDLLTFPPMDSNARKTLHTLASKFNIKSKSTGNTEHRRPVLHRTKRTMAYRHLEFEEVFNRRGRTYFHRMDMQRVPRAPGKGRGANHAGVTYRDGEVVGGSAPELSQSNKGRTMLEKMGWSTGMALGATDNKGILQPVAHVVKRTKAGLG